MKRLVLLFACCLVFVVVVLCQETPPLASTFDHEVYGQSDLTSTENTTALYSPRDVEVTPEGYVVVINLVSAFSQQRLTVFYQTKLDNFSTVLAMGGVNPGSIEDIKGSFFLGGFGFFNITQGYSNLLNPSTFTQVIPSPAPPNIYGMSYDPVTNLVYIPDYANHYVRAYTFGEYSNVMRVYGDGLNTASSTSIPGPFDSDHDCEGGLWVVDSLGNRVLHYASNTSTVDIVLGQPDFTSDSSDTIYRPNGLALSSDCRALYIADYNRIVRFVAPFSTGQPINAVMDTSVFGSISPSGMKLTETIKETAAGTTRESRLYIADRRSNRVIAATVQVESATPSPSISITPSTSFSSSISSSPSISYSASSSISASPSTSDSLSASISCKRWLT